MRSLIVPALLAAMLVGTPAAAAKDTPYQKDVKFALAEIGKACKKLLRQKGIDWRAVTKEFKDAAKDVEDDQAEYVLLLRLIARVRDGHASVIPGDGVSVKWPVEGRQRGPSMFWCRDAEGNVLVKTVWGDAASAGVTAGMRVVEVEGENVEDWLEKRIAERRELKAYSTDHHDEFSAFHFGLTGPEGSLMALELRDPKGKEKKVRVPRKGSAVVIGPAVFLKGYESTGRQTYGKTAGGYGHIHLRECKGALPEQLDTALAAIGDVPGLILDFRGNGGGGCDHGAVFGRFLMPGKRWSAGQGHEYVGQGAKPYGGPLVVIVDQGCLSAGETVSGMFKESGRAYMIGPGPTSGMSSSKIDIELPSGKFKLRVSVATNRRTFNGGEGIEGLGVPPTEIVHYDAESLAAGIDPMVKRAEELLADFPKKAVRYNPKKAGWKPPE